MRPDAVDDLPSARLGRLTLPAPRLWKQRNAGMAPGVESGLVVQMATARAAEPVLRLQWQALVETGQSGHRVYQLPAYFDAIRAACDGSTRAELLTVTRVADQALVAVVPVSLGPLDLTFRIGPVVLWRRRLSCVNLLGSVPSAGASALPLAWLAGRVLALLPQADAVVLHAVPAAHGIWEHLVAAGPVHAIHAAMLSNWRACHTMPVPATVLAYEQQFSSKKRYNLKRQMRQLGAACGPLRLSRIESGTDLDLLFHAFAALAPAPALRRAMADALAANGLLLCYVLRAGDKVVGAIVGTRSAHVLHVHNIYVDASQRHLSVGATTLHLAMEDMIGMGCFRLLDFGYGTPRHDFTSSHVLATRAQLAIARRGQPVRHWLTAHRVFHVITEYLIARVKAMLRQWRAR